MLITPRLYLGEAYMAFQNAVNQEFPLRLDLARNSVVTHFAKSPRLADKQGRSANEQNTQQSPGFGLRIIPQPPH